jgi:hypothetical protein
MCEVKIVQYADDIVFLAKKRTHLQILLDLCLAHTNRNQFVFNCSKSVLFAERVVFIYGEVILKSKSFNYFFCFSIGLISIKMSSGRAC